MPEVTQVPHAQLMANVFGAEGDVSGLLQIFAHMQLDRIQCIRQVAASLEVCKTRVSTTKP